MYLVGGAYRRKSTILVSTVLCYNIVSQTGWLKTTKAYFDFLLCEIKVRAC